VSGAALRTLRGGSARTDALRLASLATPSLVAGASERRVVALSVVARAMTAARAAAGTHSLAAVVSAVRNVAVTDTFCVADAVERATVRTRRLFAARAGPLRRAEAHAVLADSMSVTVIRVHARAVAAVETEVHVVAHAHLTALSELRALAVTGASLYTRAHGAVFASKAFETLALASDAKSLTGTLIRTRLDVATLSGPSRLAVANAVFAGSAISAVVVRT